MPNCKEGHAWNSKKQKCVPVRITERRFKTKGYDEASAKVKASLKMTPEQKIAALRAKKAKSDSTRGKSALQLAREAVERHRKRK